MEPSNFKLGIGIPNNYGTVPTPFFETFAVMEKPPGSFFIRSGRSHDLAGLRNLIVDAALKANCTHLFMCDSDQTYLPDTINRLLSRKKDIVGCMVCRRYPPFDPLMLRGDIGHYEFITDWTEGDLVEVDATGTGALLFNMDVFRNMPAPWFFFRGEPKDPVGEDIGFCSDARKAGYQIYVDTGCPAGHLSQVEVTLATHYLFAALDKAKAEYDLNVTDRLLKVQPDTSGRA